MGKSSLIGQFCNREFQQSYKATIGADFMTKELQVGDHVVTLQIWDTAGQERFHSLGIAFYRGADACILVYALDDRDSLRNLQRWKDEFLIQTSMDPRRFPFVVLGNKADLPESDRVINVDDAIEWTRQSGHVAHFLTSAKDGTHVDRAFSVVVNRALEGVLALSSPGPSPASPPQRRT